MDIETILDRTRQDASWLSCRRAAANIQKLSESGQWKSGSRIRAAFLSSFMVQPLIDYLIVELATADILLDNYSAPYGQVAQEVLSPESTLYAFKPEITLIAAEYETLDPDPVQAANRLVQLTNAFRKQTSSICVVCTFIANPLWPFHLLQSENETLIEEANNFLKKTFSNDPQIQICDIDQLAAYYGYVNAYSPEMMSMARIPFSEGFLAELSRKVFSHVRYAKGLTKKCLVLDCDNTLWGGIVGEDGMDGIVLGPDWPGREFIEFQKTILELYDQGVILAINSKNNEADVMQVLRDHPHMLLREKHFAAICINWNPKPDNMKILANEINIGLDSLVFIDDNPAERQLMRQMLPEVEVLEIPNNPALYSKTLRETNFFARASLTEEDKKRGQIYAAQRKRSQLQQSATTLEDYLKSLEMACSIWLAEEKDIKRAAQLIQRTNQFNLTTRRYSESDIQQMLENPNWNVYVLGLKDKFGDNGTVGLALVEKQGKNWRIDTFLMSCRVIGRQAEDALLDCICRDAISENAQTIIAEYIKTAKNPLVSDFWDKMNFTKTESNEMTTRYAFEIDDYQLKTFEYLNLKK